MDTKKLSFACPSCGKKVAAPARFAGRSAPCPGCGASLLVPAPVVSGPAVADPVPRLLDPLAEAVSFNCRLCGTRMQAPLEYVGRKAKCPDCDALTVIPPPPAPAKSRRPQAMDEETYEVYEGDQPRGVDLARASVPTIAFVCRVCQTHLSAEASHVGELVPCPDCGTKTPVPAPPQPIAATFALTGETYEVAVADEAPPVEGKRTLFDEYAEKPPIGYRKHSAPAQSNRRPDPDERSASTTGWGIGLFDGLGTAFTRAGMLQAWLGLSLGLLLIGGMGGVVFGSFAAPGGMFGVMGGMLLVISFAFATTLYLIVSCAIYWSVFDDAAGGAQRVHGWPAFDFSDWVPPTLTIFFAVLVSAIPGAIAAKLLLGVTAWPWPLDTTAGWTLVGSMLVFPVAVLSQLNESSMWAVLSPGVLRTMPFAPATWLAFYASTFGLAIGSMWISEDLVDGLGPWSLLLLAPFEVFIDLFYAWMLGRLAWIAGAKTPVGEADS